MFLISVSATVTDNVLVSWRDGRRTRGSRLERSTRVVLGGSGLRFMPDQFGALDISPHVTVVLPFGHVIFVSTYFLSCDLCPIPNVTNLPLSGLWVFSGC